jgi:hypothetical protein
MAEKGVYFDPTLVSCFRTIFATSPGSRHRQLHRRRVCTDGKGDRIEQCDDQEGTGTPGLKLVLGRCGCRRARAERRRVDCARTRGGQSPMDAIVSATSLLRSRSI